MKTYFPKQKDVQSSWYLIDAKDAILGKLATKAADIVRGKHKATFSPHLDMGDFVVVINAKDIKVTGTKMSEKLYRSHSGYFGHLKEISLQEMLEKKPELVIEKAVLGMLPKNGLRREFIKKLKVYGGAEHPHAAQQPKSISL